MSRLEEIKEGEGMAFFRKILCFFGIHHLRPIKNKKNVEAKNVALCTRKECFWKNYIFVINPLENAYLRTNGVKITHELL